MRCFGPVCTKKLQNVDLFFANFNFAIQIVLGKIFADIAIEQQKVAKLKHFILYFLTSIESDGTPSKMLQYTLINGYAKYDAFVQHCTISDLCNYIMWREKP